MLFVTLAINNIPAIICFIPAIPYNMIQRHEPSSHCYERSDKKLEQ